MLRKKHKKCITVKYELLYPKYYETKVLADNTGV